MVRVLAEDDVAGLLDLTELLVVVEEAFRKQGRGEIERPDRPHFPVGAGLDAEDPERGLGTSLVMPAYVHGAAHYATKLVGVHEGNTQRNLPTVNAQIVLMEATTGLPAAYMAGTRITNARTGCIGGLAARELADGPLDVAIFGAGTQARWQARAIAIACEVESIEVYSPSESKRECASDLETELGVPANAAESPEQAVSRADVVVTATTSQSPVFPGTALDAGALVVAVGAYTGEMRELDARTIERAGQVFADVPEEAAETGDVRNTGVEASELVALANVFEGRAGRESDEEILVVESVGTAVLDAAVAEDVFECAAESDVGTTLSL